MAEITTRNLDELIVKVIGSRVKVSDLKKTMKTPSSSKYWSNKVYLKAYLVSVLGQFSVKELEEFSARELFIIRDAVNMTLQMFKDEGIHKHCRNVLTRLKLINKRD